MSRKRRIIGKGKMEFRLRIRDRNPVFFRDDHISGEGTMSTNTFDEALKGLKRSPLFNLSLASKELFHSNFLAWCLELWPEEAWKAWHSLIPSEAGFDAKERVKKEGVHRELNHHDLEVDFEGGKKLVVEVKVKSLPSLEQLKRYANKLDNQAHLVLLSPKCPDFMEDSRVLFLTGKYTAVSCSWIALSKLAARLADNPTGEEPKPGPPPPFDNGYANSILKDYGAMTSQLESVLDLTDLGDGNSRWLMPKKEIEALRDARIHDVVEKRRCNEAVNRLKKKYLKDAKEDVPENERNTGQIIMGSGMTRGTGLLHVGYMLHVDKNSKDYVEAGIQVQGNQYRYFLMVKGPAYKGRANESACKLLADNDLWFPKIPSEGITKFPEKTLKDFCTYSGNFWYRYHVLSQEVQTAQLLECIAKHIETLKEKKDDILSILKNESAPARSTAESVVVGEGDGA